MISFVVAILILASLFIFGFAFAGLTGIINLKQNTKQSFIYLAAASLIQLSSWLLFTGEHFQISLARDALFSILMIFLICQQAGMYLLRQDGNNHLNQASLYPVVFGAFVLFGLSKAFDVMPEFLHDTWLIIVSLALIATSGLYLAKLRVTSFKLDASENSFGFESKSLPVHLSAILGVLILGLISIFFIGKMKVGYEDASSFLISINAFVFSMIGILPFVVYALFKQRSSDVDSGQMLITDGLLLSVGISFPLFLLISKYIADKSYFIGFSDYQFWSLFFSFLITAINAVRAPGYVAGVISCVLISLLYVFNVFYM